MPEGMDGDTPLVTAEQFYAIRLPVSTSMHQPATPPRVAAGDAQKNKLDSSATTEDSPTCTSPPAVRRSARRKRRQCVEPQDCNSATALFGGLSAGALFNVAALVPLCVCMQELDWTTKVFYAAGVIIGSVVVFVIILAYLFMNT